MILSAAAARSPVEARADSDTPEEAIQPFGVPAIEGCEDILTAELYNPLKGQLVDPLEIARSWKAEGVMMPTLPLYHCLHEAWLVANGIPNELSEASTLSWPDASGLEPEFSLFSTLTVSLNIPLPWTGTASTSGFTKWQNEPAISLDPTTTSPARLVAASNSGYNDPNCPSPLPGTTKTAMALFATLNGDGTAPWTYACAPWPANPGSPCGTTCSNSAGDPSVAWDANGFGYASYLLISNCTGCQFPGLSAGVAVAKYNPGTNAWTPLSYVVKRFSDNTNRPDKPFIHIDTSATSAHKNRLYVTWAEAYGAGSFDQSNQLLAFSDNGTTWTTRTLDSPGTGVKVNGGNITTDAAGNVYAVWQRWTGSNPEASIFSKSTDGGLNWATGTTIYTHGDNMGTCYIRPEDLRGLNAFGMLDSDNNSASPFSGRLYFVTNDVAPGAQCGDDNHCFVGQNGGSVNVYLLYSNNQGQTWTQSSSTVNQPPDPVGSIGYHFSPWMSVDPSDGTVNVIFYDTRGFLSNNFSTQMFYARSSDGGGTFEPNALLTDNGTNLESHIDYSSENPCLNLHGPQLPDQQGEYIGTAAGNRRLYYVATDTRQFWNGPDNPLKEDIAMASVINCGPPTWDALAPTAVCDAAAGATNVSWHAATSPGTGATAVAYHVYRGTTSGCAGAVEITPGAGVSGITFADTTGVPGTVYYYKIVAKNDCPGTVLTPFSLTSACSTASTFPSVIDPTIYSPTTAVCASSTGNKASAPFAPASSTYLWTATNGTITAGATSQVVTYTAGASGTVTLNVTVSNNACSRGASLGIPTAANLVSNSIATLGSTSVCRSGSGGTATVTDSANGGAITHQWGYRTVSGGAITPIAGQTGTTYRIVATDFTNTAGTYYLVCTSTPQCGTAKISNQVTITITSSIAPAKPVVTTPFSAAPTATNLTASVPSNPPVTYAWSITGGTIVSGSTSPTLTFNPISAGTTITLQTIETLSSCASAPGIGITQTDFNDVPPSNPYHDAIDIIAKNGITSGCGTGNYCPGSNITRDQMAVFLLKAEHGASYVPLSCSTTHVFDDVVCPSPFANFIGQLFQEGITAGCGGNSYCPSNPVDRATMAVLLLKTKLGAGYVPPTCHGIFTDVACPGGFAVDWIEDLYNRGITAGCSGAPPNPVFYCPTNSVTRDTMANFVRNTFGLQ